jgi:hypothetical protein
MSKASWINKSAEETLQFKRRQAGADCLRLLKWLEPLGAEVREGKGVDPTLVSPAAI